MIWLMEQFQKKQDKIQQNIYFRKGIDYKKNLQG